MLNPERNDVNVEKLFHWGNLFSIYDTYGKEIDKLYIRLVGDSEVNKARVFAIRKSSELRKKLKTEDTDERIAFLSGIYDIEEKDDIIKYILLLSTKQFTPEAMRTIKFTLPKEPKSTASLEEFEEYQKQVDSFQDRKLTMVMDTVTKQLEDYQEELKNKTVEQLRKQYEKMMIDDLCEKEMVTRFRDMCVYFGSYSDAGYKEKYFENFEQFDNLPTEIKEQLINYYNSLEINVEELKKLLEATQ